jgi:hypothetical protein
MGVVVVVGLLAGSYWFGYQAGLRDQGPDYRALVTVRRNPGDPNSQNSSCVWFDLRKPGDAAKLRQAEERLKANGAEYYVAKGVMEFTLNVERDPRRVNAHK